MSGMRRAGGRALTAVVLVALGAACVPRADAQTLPPGIFLEQLASGLQRPIEIANAGDASNRLFIVQQTGLIRIYDLDQGMLLATPFLNLSALITSGDFEGVLSLAFHPQYQVNGRFFVLYLDTNLNQVVARFTVSAMDPNQANPAPDAILFSLPHAQVQFPHYGGQLHFGPDGFLYITLGDGTSVGDADNHGQRLDVLLGKVLRLDVDTADPYAIPPTNPFVGVPGARGEIWARGLRNPWRFSFDRDTGEMFVSDVGESQREEVNHQPAASPGGENYGWRRMEGSLCFNPSSNCNDGTLTLPAFEYAHTADPCGGSIAGGYRYRGERYPQMEGVYLFGEFCLKRIYGAVQQQDGAWTFSELLNPNFNVVTFGEDEAGEIYVTDFFSGRLHHIAANNPVPALTALLPDSVDPGGSDFALTVTGSGFVPDSVVRWNGADRVTSFAGTTELTATILASDIAAEGTAQVTVFSPAPVGGTSNPLNFTVVVHNPVPSVDLLSPPSALAGVAGFPLTVTGSGFVPASVVRWDGSDRPTAFVSDTELTATISAGDLAAAGMASVTVFNPAPGGGESGAANFTINNPLPALTMLAPASADAGGGDFTLTVTGSGFVSGSVVRWNGSDRPTTFVGSMELRATISAGLITQGGTVAVAVFNPAPGGGLTGPVNFSVDSFAVGIAPGSPNTATVLAGQTAQYSFVVTPSGSFDTATTFACSGLPSLSSCSFSPSPVTPGSQPATVTLRVATTGPASASLMAPTEWGGFGTPGRLLVSSLALMFLLAGGRRRRSWAAVAGVAVLVIALAGCGGGGGGGFTPSPQPARTPAGTYVITVTANSGTFSQSFTVTLTVQ